jgi:hypothetical protein
MASINGTTLTYGNSQTQTTAGGKIINYGFAKYSVRSTMPNAGSSEYTFWNGASMNRSRTDSYIRATAMLPGHGYNSFPYGGCFCALVRPDGSRLNRWTGTLYQPNLEGGAQEILWFTDYTWSSSDIGTQTGTYRLDFGMWSNNGSDNRWCVTWNPNASDDSRGFQKGSVSFIEEIAYA